MYLTTFTDEVIEQFVAEAASTMIADRRQSGRYPFFRPMTITPHDTAEIKSSAFIRNISRTGIGLLHNRRLEAQRATLTIPMVAGRSVDIKTEITWCESYGEGWYPSGGPFIGLSASEAISLFSTTFLIEVNRRFKRRYPFFRPVTITPHDAAGTKLSAFIRDISRNGIGLLHNRRLETQRVTLTILTIGGRSVDIKTEIKWCKSCGEGWYVSGGLFTRIWAETLPDLLL